MKRKKVLIVEDDFIIRLFLSKVLVSLNFDIIGIAGSYEESMKILEKNSPDVIIMDIGINGNKDGIEASSLINQKIKIPVIFITGNSDAPTLERAKKANPLLLIYKPIDENALRNELEKIKEKI